MTGAQSTQPPSIQPDPGTARPQFRAGTCARVVRSGLPVARVWLHADVVEPGAVRVVRPGD